MENMIEKGFAEKVKQGASSKYIKVHTATRWNIRHSLMLHWFADLMNVTEVTIHRRNVSTLLSSAFIRGDLSAATRSPVIWSLGQRTSLPVEDIINLLSFCLKTTQFTYGGTYYLKVFGGRGTKGLSHFTGWTLFLETICRWCYFFMQYPEMKRSASCRI